MRLFVGVPVDDQLRSIVASWLGPRVLPGKPVPPENWHVTLRFVGAADDVGRDRLAAELDQRDLGLPFTVGLGGVGGFPRPSKATVGYMDVVTGVAKLAELASAADAAVGAAGFGQEERPFRPHLTLSRIRPPADLRPLQSERLDASMRVDTVVLYRSRVGRGGARYEVLERFPLG